MKKLENKKAEEKHEERKSGWKIAFIILLIVLLITFVYSILRYNVFKGVGIEHLPLYISNKALALAATIMIGLSFLLGPLCRFSKRIVPKLYLRKYIGLLGFGIAAIHGVISLLLFNPAYYQKFFAETGKLTLEGELSMLFGILAIFIFAAISITSIPSVESGLHPKQWKFIQRSGYLAYLLVLLHVLVMGFSGWFDASKWPGGMYPITLVAFSFIVFVLLIRVIVMIFPKKEN